MNNQFSPNVSEVLAFSREEAMRLSCGNVLPEHLLMALLRERSGKLAKYFQELHVDTTLVKQSLEKQVMDRGTHSMVNARELVMDDKASNILRLAVLESRLQHAPSVDVEHLLLAILRDQVK